MTDAAQIFRAARAIQEELTSTHGPPPQGFRAPPNGVVSTDLFRNTRGYLTRVANQANGAYANGWYDACAVMLRRLIETLIIEAFEKHNLAAKIQNGQGDFLYLRDLIDRTVSEASWNLSRNTKSALPRLKDVGDKSAHSRRFNAVRDDVEKLIPDIRVVSEELLSLSGWR